MLRFKVTNVSDAPRYLIEAARLLQPGESVTVNRLDASTRDNTKMYLVEEGEFGKISPAKKAKIKPREDDDELNKGVSPTTMAAGPAQLVTAKHTKRVVPLQALDADAETDVEEGDEPVRSASTDDDDELAGLIPTAAKVVEQESVGFTDRKGHSASETA